MNDDQTPEGVEITDYVGEAAAPHSAHRSTSGGKAEDVTSPQLGSWAITGWAVVGLLCVVAYIVSISRTTNSPTISPSLIIAIMGGLISLIAVTQHRRASKPTLVQVIGSLALALAIILIIFAILDTYLISGFDLA